MPNKFLPYKYVKSIYSITPAFLKEEGMEALLLDVDNTMISNTVTKGDEKLAAWIESMKAAGIKLCIVSNGKGKRVKTFNIYGIPAVFFAVKPRRRGFERALKLIGMERSKTAVVGDQIFTDIWGGNRCGMKTILVVPIDKHEGWGIRFKRIFERKILRKLQPED